MTTLSRGSAAAVAALAFYAMPGCSEPIVTPGDAPPSVTLLSPVPAADGTPPQVRVGEGLEFAARVSDGFDPPERLEIEWTASYFDAEAGAYRDIELGTSVGDTDGRTAIFVSFSRAAVHTVEVRVVDSDGLDARAFVDVDVRDDYGLPTVSILSPLDGATFDQGEDVPFAGVASGGGGPETFRVTWLSDRDGVLSDDAPAVDGSMSFVRDDLSPGAHVVTVTVADGDDQIASDSVGLTVTAVDQPPGTPGVEVFPADPRTDDDLSCVAFASDPEGGAVVYEYSWKVDGVDSGFGLAVLDAAQTTRDQVWTCEARAGDGTQWSAVGAASVTVDNTPPSFASVVLQPLSPLGSDVLTCDAGGWDDADGDPQGGRYQWMVNGVEVAFDPSPSLIAPAFARGDAVTCFAWPDDGTDLGVPIESNEVLIGNAAPGAPVVTVVPDPARGVDDLTCSVVSVAVDPDGDAVSYRFAWWRDGVSEPSHVSSTVPASATSLGEVWTCRATPTDGDLDGPWAEASAEVLPEEGDLVITELMVRPGAVDDASGEYVEVYNASPEDIDLAGWAIADAGGERHVVSAGGPVTVRAGRYAVLGRNGNSATNGGIYVDYQYSGFALDEVRDEVILEIAGFEVDRVEFDTGAGFPSLWGQALSLDPSSVEATLNDDGGNWCGATTPIGNSGDFGTPGEANDACDCFWADGDGDGYGDGPSCALPDCDDSQPLVHPRGVETCEDGIDQDCDGMDLLCDCAGTDDDGDGYGDGATCSPADCDDDDPDVNPGAAETCDFRDEDCDGSVDEGYDQDGDGWSTCEGDCNDSASGIRPYWFELCDGVDNDCDGTVDEGFDTDGDGWTTCGGDCDDTTSGRNPGRADTDCDGVDDDCDEAVDDDNAGDSYEPNDETARNVSGDDQDITISANLWPEGEWDVYSVSAIDDEGWCGFFEDCFEIHARLSSIPSSEDYDLFMVKNYLPALEGRSWSEVYNDVIAHDGIASANGGSTDEQVDFYGTVDLGGDGDGGTWYVIVRAYRATDGSCSDGYSLRLWNTG